MSAIGRTLNRFLKVYIVRTIFEKVPFLRTIFNRIDGKKILIGRIGVALSIVLYMVAHEFPEIPHVNEIYTTYMMIISWAFQELGIQHRIDKEERERLLTSEFDGLLDNSGNPPTV